MIQNKNKKILYKSTRGGEKDVSFNKILLMGTASDGGLYVPQELPKITKAEWSKYFKFQAFLSDFLIRMGLEMEQAELFTLVNSAYKKFWKEDFLSLTPIGKSQNENYLLNLFYGPTESFKDYPLAPMGAIINAILRKEKKKAIVLTATSGDTGSAALSGLVSQNVLVNIIYPHEKISDIQERQMIHFANQKDKAYAFAVEDSNFDLCQSTVKRVFADHEFMRELEAKGYMLISANSINWMRICIQTAYMAWIAMQAPGSTIVVPSGNSGHWLAAWYAKKIFGEELIKDIKIATNDNNILEQVFSTGKHIEGKDVIATTSPSMDILISSNLERPISHILGEERTAELYKNKNWEITADELALLNKEIPAKNVFSVQQDEVKKTQRYMRDHHNITVDPHTATGLALLKNDPNKIKNHIFVSTANASKFIETTGIATGCIRNSNTKLIDKDKLLLINFLDIETSDLTKSLFATSEKEIAGKRKKVSLDSYLNLEHLIRENIAV